MIDGKQMTLCWHADDIKASHENPKVVDNFVNWIKEKYGKIGEVKVKRGNEHDCLGMVLRYEGKKVLIDMTKYVKEMHEEYGEHKYQKVSSPAADGLFECM